MMLNLKGNRKTYDTSVESLTNIYLPVDKNQVRLSLFLWPGISKVCIF